MKLKSTIVMHDGHEFSFFALCPTIQKQIGNKINETETCIIYGRSLE